MSSVSPCSASPTQLRHGRHQRNDTLLAAAAMRVRASTARGGAGCGPAEGEGVGATPPPQFPNPPRYRARSPSRGEAASKRTPARPACDASRSTRLGCVDLPSTCRQRVLMLQSAPPRIRGARSTAHPGCPPHRTASRTLHVLRTKCAVGSCSDWRRACCAGVGLLFRTKRPPLSHLRRTRDTVKLPGPDAQCLSSTSV